MSDTESKKERPIVSPDDGSAFVKHFYEAKQDRDTEASTEKSPGVSLEEAVIACLKKIYDPEIPVNIYDLGLIYGVEANASGDIVITMTLTTPHCPVAEIMPGEVESKARGVAGVADVIVNLVWDPPWDPSRMSEEARLELGFL